MTIEDSDTPKKSKYEFMRDANVKMIETKFMPILKVAIDAL